MNSAAGEPVSTRDRTPVAIAPEVLARTSVHTTFDIAPVGNVMGDVAGVIGESVLALMGMFYPRALCRKANVVVTELVQNVVENVSDPGGPLHCEVEVDADKLRVLVRNRVTAAQWTKVQARVHEIDSTPDLRALVARTIRARRDQKLKGGLGLMRLAHENKFRIVAAFVPEPGDAEDRGMLTVEATYRVRESE